MALSASDKATIAARISSDAADRGLVINLTKPQLQAAIEATEIWITNNAASFNAALPPAAQSQSMAFKARLLAFVATRLVA